LLLALLGLDDQTLAIAAAAVRSGRHRVALVCDLPAGGIKRLEAEGVYGAEAAPWESLMVGGRFEAVVVASAESDAGEDQRTEQLRKLVQESVPLLLAHPVLNSMLACYEIDMIRRESHCIVLPFLPARCDPAIQRLGQLLRDPEQSPVGRIEQVVFERAATDRSRRAVLSHFARDVDLIRLITGDVLRVGALGSSASETAYANLTVQMSGEGPAVIRWSILPVNADSGEYSGGWLRIIATKDRLEIAPPGSDSSRGARVAELADEADEHGEGSEGAIVGGSEWDASLAVLEQLAQAIEGGEIFPDWSEAIRDIELTEAIPRSLARGRTIDVQHEQPTEEGTFKGLMTSLGCGLLLVGLGLVVVMAMLDAVARANNWRALSAVLRPWPWVLCGVFGVFLAFQVLLRLTKREDGEE
jgi:predicted dehydrogenase